MAKSYKIYVKIESDQIKKRTSGSNHSMDIDLYVGDNARNNVLLPLRVLRNNNEFTLWLEGQLIRKITRLPDGQFKVEK